MFPFVISGDHFSNWPWECKLAIAVCNGFQLLL